MSGLVPKLLPSVVSIVTKSLAKPSEAGASASASQMDLKESYGTGFIIDPQGYIATNRHVIDNAYDVVVTLNDGTRLSATVVGHGRNYDLALLKVDPIYPLEAAHFGDSDAMQVGDPVLAIGNPFGLGIAVSGGIVSGLDRDLHFSRFDAFIQTDAAINHGNSGGPLFNTNGEVIGINTALYSNNTGGGSVGIGYAIPASAARLLLPLLKQYGYLRFGSLEVAVQVMRPDLADALGVPQKGVLIDSIGPESSAAGKLQLGDIVLKAGGQEVNRPHDFYRRVAEALDQQIGLEIWRRGKIMRVEVTPTQSPGEAPEASKEMPHPTAEDPQMMQRGTEVAPLTPDSRKRFNLSPDQTGVVVTKVLPHSLGAAAGLSVGDVIVALQMEPVKDPADATRIIEKAKAEGRHFIVGLVKGTNGMRFVTTAMPTHP
jgi:serine protease Do